MYAAVLTEAVNSDLFQSSGILAFYQSISFAWQEGFIYLRSKAIAFSKYFVAKLSSCTSGSIQQLFLYTEYSNFRNGDVFKGSQSEG